MADRATNISRLRDGLFDVLVVGGGINGAVSAASLAGRGASVALIDRSDFGSFTSQESSNLVWGGFKYLENYELPLVFNLCRSRNRLMKSYPDNIREISFLAALARRHEVWLTAGMTAPTDSSDDKPAPKKKKAARKSAAKAAKKVATKAARKAAKKKS